MSIELRDFQREGVERIRQNELTTGYGSVLAFDMGLGKTLTMASFLIEQRIQENPENSDLIIVPLSVLSQWENEILSINQDMKIHIYHGLNRDIPQTQYDFIITTYHSLVTRELEQYTWNRIVLDEAHIIRNGIGNHFKTIPKRALGAFSLIQHSKYRHCITGTPYNNNTNDILSLIKFIGIPNINILDFIDQYVIQKTKDNLIQPIQIETIMIDNPNLSDIPNYLKYLSTYRKLSYLLKTKTNPVEIRSIYQNLLLILTKLRLYCDIMANNQINKFQIKDFEEQNEIETEQEQLPETETQNTEIDTEINFYDNSIKIKTVCDKIIDIIHTVPYKRILIFSSFVITLDILENIINQQNPDIQTYKYTGKQNRHQRQIILNEFTNKHNTQPMILFSSLGAGSCGLNLTPCSTVFLVDISMNPFDQLQAINRVHRITQTEQVNVYKFCMKNMIEETILNGNQNKISEAKQNGLLIL